MKRAALLVAVASLGCSSTNASPDLDASTPAADSAPDARESGASGDSASGPGAVLEDFDAGPGDFDCVKNNEWSAVGLSHYKNELGHGAQMLSVATSADGGTYPVGTIVQLNPAEAMVKRGQGFNASSNDWEFFTLSVSDAGTTITARGGGSSVSNAIGTCLGCHAPAQVPWDLICGDDPDGGATTAHDCAPLPVPNSVLAALVDPRCP